MDADLALTLGLIISALSIPSILSAVTDGRAPRASAVTVLIGGALVLYAMSIKPTGYEFSQVPDIFLRVVGRFMN